MRGTWVAKTAVVALMFYLAMGPNLAEAQTGKSGWQQEWEKTVKAAEKEGQVTVYIAGYDAIIVSGAFQRAFPQIKVVSVTGSGSQLAPRIAAERRAGRYLADVYGGGGNSLYQILYLGKMLDPIKPALILPEVVDETKWFEGKHKYVDREGQQIIVYEGDVSAGAFPAYNTNLINPKEFKTYRDFLNPKWKGKILGVDLTKVRGAGTMWQFMYYHPDLGPDFIRSLYGGMEVTLTGDLRQAVDWLATGRYPLCIPCRDVPEAQNQGLPVAEFAPYHFKEGITLSSAFGQLAIMNRAPHPAAAKVFVNWLLSREGQMVFQKVMSLPADPRDSRRIDVAKDHISPDKRRQAGIPYFDPDHPDTKDITPIIKLLNDILAKRR